MNKIKNLFSLLIKLGVIWSLAITYKMMLCAFAKQNYNAEMICYLNWKDGFIFLSAFTLISMVEYLFENYSLRKKMLFSLLVYSVVYSVVALPYFLSSFIQPLSTNSFLHTFFVIIILELVFSKKCKRTQTSAV
jgi:hypothetical protein